MKIDELLNDLQNGNDDALLLSDEDYEIFEDWLNREIELMEIFQTLAHLENSGEKESTAYQEKVDLARLMLEKIDSRKDELFPDSLESAKLLERIKGVEATLYITNPREINPFYSAMNFVMDKEYSFYEPDGDSHEDNLALLSIYDQLNDIRKRTYNKIKESGKNPDEKDAYLYEEGIRGFTHETSRVFYDLLTELGNADYSDLPDEVSRQIRASQFIKKTSDRYKIAYCDRELSRIVLNNGFESTNSLRSPSVRAQYPEFSVLFDIHAFDPSRLDIMEDPDMSREDLLAQLANTISLYAYAVTWLVQSSDDMYKKVAHKRTDEIRELTNQIDFNHPMSTIGMGNRLYVDAYDKAGEIRTARAYNK